MRICISGYQVIQDAELIIDGITMVTGSNNHGKSSIIRAAESCLFSEQGDDFINDEMGVVQVQMEFEQEEGFPETKIVWEKGRSTGAIYYINGERYAKERGKPPVELMSSLGFREVVVRDRKQRLYFWRLHDGLFMVVDHPSYVFGFISNLMEHEKIVPVLKEMAKEGDEVKNRLKDIESKCQVYETEIENTRLAAEELKDILDSQKDDIQMIEDGVSMLKGLETYEIGVIAHNKAIKFCSQQINMISKIIPEEGALEEIEKGISTYEALLGYRESVTQATMRIKNLNRSLNVVGDFNVSRDDLSSIKNEIDRFTNLKLQQAQLTLYRESILMLKKAVDDEKRNLSQKKAKFEDLKNEIGICPLCGKEF